MFGANDLKIIFGRNKMQLCLGTVQFGMNYGIKNQKKPEIKDALACLDFATQNGIYAIDTATAYGTAEQITGEFLNKKTLPRENLFISTKLKPNVLDDVESENYVRVIRENLKRSLRILHLDYVDAYLLHSSRYAYDTEILDALAEMKKEGLARKVGVSVYDVEEALCCMAHKRIEFLQAPYSIFDHRMKVGGVFANVLPNGCEIDTRSAFIQGLVTMSRDEVPSYLNAAKPILEKLDKISSETGWSRIDLAMGYVKHEQEISHLVFGIDSLEQLKEDIFAFQKEMPDNMYEEIERQFQGIEADIVMPSLWKR